MKYLKNILLIIIFIYFVNYIIMGHSNYAISTNYSIVQGEPVKVSVLLYRFDDAYISLVKKSLEEIEVNNHGKVKFDFYNGENNQTIQNETLDTILNEKKADLILLNLVDTRSTKQAVDKIKENNIPVVLFNREPIDIEAIKSYNKSYFVGTNAREAGIIQGNILVNQWRQNKTEIDRNKDDIMQYIMLIGKAGNIEAFERSKYSVLTINNAGIKTQELGTKVCNWNQEEGKNAMRALLSQWGNKIEAVISNNDSMAIGAIEALQEQGYNNGDKTKIIPVIGVDAIPKAQELIKEGIMTGSVLQDPFAMAEALYYVGINLVYNRSPLDGTEYKFDETGVAIRIPYKEYIVNQ
ncbi:galactose ABC transporter substrate-binding protein [Clostridium sp. C2-6-12]|uniref:galactose ABC transporter substrate-binding protein n=1 Tax=Clostridium sp. C2-6-12 TaxID=2698832 RepID=UPI0013699634|nr:galactose ABC transporter substrate-binding protein [Clostridium sp. C2-6-12]